MHPTSPGTVLIIDDEVAHQRILRAILEDGGYTVRVAGTGAGALCLAASLAPELIILDVALPDADGFSICRSLKAVPALAATPVIFCSGAHDTPSKTSAFAAGAVDFVAKPFEAPEVLARARAQIGLYRLQSRLEHEVAARTADLRAQVAANEALLEELRRERALLTERVATRTEELRALNARLGQTLQAKDAFLAGMSHELRTPLNAILGLAELLDEGLYGELAERQRRVVGTIASSGQHLLSLINDILDLAKIEAGREELDLDAVPPDEICHMAAGLVADMASARGVQLVERIPADPPALRADGRRLRQILVNLLANAVKFTPEGGEVGLELASEAGGAVVRFTVWDTGVGIAEGQHDRLFHAFTQVGGGLSRQAGGSGLGLALVARLARLHGGSVALASAAGAGSRLSVAVPRGMPDAATPEPAGDAPAVLLLDDHEQTAGALAATVRAAGYRCTTAQSLEAGELALSLRPCAVLVTLPMGDHQGAAALRRISARVPAGTPVVALGSVLLADSAARAVEAGAAAHLPLPLLAEELARALRAVAP